MRVALYPSSQGTRLCVVIGDELCDVARGFESYLTFEEDIDARTANAAAQTCIPQDIGAFFADSQHSFQRVEQVVDFVNNCSAERREALRMNNTLISLENQALRAPIAANARIFCVGLNYRAHVIEVGAEFREYPPLHFRTHESLVGHHQNIVRPKLSEQLDWEIEMTAVIGTAGRYIDKADALGHVGGYTIMNEGSVRDFISKKRGSLPGNDFDGSGSLGPWIVTADEIVDPGNLNVCTTVNGVVMQDANTSDLIFNLATLISLISEFAALQPGDLIATGSPSGVAVHRHPQPWLKAGDVATFSVEGIGELRNDVMNEA